ncbi:MAG TPA: hypothetical protein VLS46_07035, partial [Gaiellaceae bacterium]|nr:hypothetical protein [Gaiellaceae bacterium]
LTGPANAGDTWTLTVGTTATPYEIPAYDPTASATATAFAGIADALSGYTAFAIGSTLYVTALTAGSFPIDVTFARDGDAGDAGVGGTPRISWTQRVQLDGAGTPDARPGDIWRLTIGAATIDYLVASGVTTLDGIALGFTGAITGATVPGVVDSTEAGGIVVLRSSTGAPLDVGPVKQFRTKAYDDGAAPTADARPHYLQSQFDVSGSYVSGETWTATIDGVRYSVPLPSLADRNLRTTAEIASRLAAAISADPRYEATAVGSRITIVDVAVGPTLSPLAGDDPFTLAVTREGGNVRGVFDIDNANVLEGFRTVSVTRDVVLFQFFGFIFSIPITTTQSIGFTANLTLELYDQNDVLLASDGFLNLSPVHTIAPTLLDGTRTGNAVDVGAWPGARILIEVGAFSNLFLDPGASARIVLEESEDGSTWTQIAADDLVGGGAILDITSANDEQAHERRYLGEKRYVRARVAQFNGADFFFIRTELPLTVTVLRARDIGSSSDRDPFIEYEFTAAGKYKLVVGSRVDFQDGNGFFTDTLEGVAFDQSYDLLV